ncbi:hypothetical protein BV25DRAFT_1833110 [Artomyces pyxidatus]|uniref:Uncharacterized protein n=1 Tax=Artomyces pyxidatus TaxID=48021 RepID=A0ACB8SGY1_9AGAM|nr:hypothetical protein BV25DRAFT_1833110 [Artomyces pyxidatus]
MTHKNGWIETVSEEIKTAPLQQTTILDLYPHGSFDGVVSSPQHVTCRSVILKFPPELLICVFGRIAKDDPLLHVPASNTHPRRRKLGWVAVSHVCRQWRDIAVGSPTLWQDIDFALGPEWVPDMLARSKALPVTIRKTFPSGQGWFPHELDLLTAHLFHTKRLFLSGDPTTLTSAVQSLNTPAPILEYLDLHFNQVMDDPFAPSQFFAGHTPRLLTLSLTNYGLAWRVNLPTARLANLIIKYERGSGRYHLLRDFASLLDLVESIPTLQSLYAASNYRSHDQEAWSGPRVVRLPHLKRLQIDSGKYKFLSLVNHIEIPPTTALDFSIHPGFLAEALPASPDIRVVFPFVAKHMHATPLATLALKYEHRRAQSAYWGMEARAWAMNPTGADTDASALPAAQPALRLAGYWVSHTGAFTLAADITAHIGDAVPLGAVRTLSVESRAWVPHLWAALLARCGVLAHVHAAHAAGAAFVRALDWAPALETVALERVDLTAREELGGETLGEALVAWLRRRPGLGLRRLHLLSCEVAPEDIAAMAEVVGTVEISRALVGVEEEHGGTIFKDPAYHL